MNEKKTLAIDEAPSMRTVDANGFLHVKETPISKACVNPYLGREIPGWEDLGLKPDAIYYGLRPADELKKAAETFNGLPVLIDHHDESADNPQKEWRVGSTGTDARFDGEYLKNSLHITDQKAIDLITSGEAKELSCAYFFTPDFTPGEEGGIPYDFVMRGIKGNHVALVPEGRAGHDVKVADSGGALKERKVSMRKKKTMARDEDIIQQEETKDSIEAIVEEFFPGLDDDHKAALIERLKALAPAADEEPEEAKDEDPAECADEDIEKPEGDDEDWLSEKMKDPAFKEAFKIGVKYGEKRDKADTERIDEDHEREGEEKRLELTGDTIAAIKTQAKREVINEFKARTKAANAVRGLVNITDVMAFDSAYDIYAAGLRGAGYDPKKWPKEAWAGMCAVLRASSPVAAMDRKPVGRDIPADIADLLK